MRNFNLPPGCSVRDIDGREMPCCDGCGEEFNDDELKDGLCEDCQPNDEENN